jgi:zinc and cadmium transporter
MSTLAQVIFFSFIGGLISLIGGFLLLSSKKHAKRLAFYATPFAAGALLAAAFLDLLPEASHVGSIDTALLWAMFGILLFFVLERFLQWFHHHHEHEGKEKGSDPAIPLIVIGDTLHNFIDGIAIAAGFLVSPETGIVVTLAVAAHEIPQEIGDFGLLLHKGMRRRNVILVNFVSALATTLAAVIFFHVGQGTELALDAILGLVAGFFIYIAVSDIIPSIHKNHNKNLATAQTIILLAGTVIVGLTTNFLHQYIDTGHSESATGSSEVHEHHDEHEDEDAHEHEHVDEHEDAHTDESEHSESDDHIQ